MTDNYNELLPVVTPDGSVVGQATRGECHGGSHLLHPVVHIHVFNPQGELYLQKRPDWKDIQPGKWDTAVGGHVDYGESVEQALHREAREELSLADVDAHFVVRYVFDGQRESELVNVYRLTCDKQAVHPSAELAGGRFWSVAEITDNLGKGIFTPNFEQEFVKILLPLMSGQAQG